MKPINEYTVYYLYDSNSFVYSDVEPSEKYKFITENTKIVEYHAQMKNWAIKCNR